jgi:NADH-quinone oxidoreductase subunit M
VLLMVCHGLTTGALFALAGGIQDRLGTRDMESLGGLWSAAPRLAAMSLFFALAAMGLPGLGNFAGEFLVLFGVIAVRFLPAVLASGAIILSAVYALSLVRRTMFGTPQQGAAVADLSAAETIAMGALTLFLVFLGLFPRTLIGVAGPFLQVLTGGGS